MYYKNTSVTVKTFYNVTFKPGEIKEVSGYINHPQMHRVFDQDVCSDARTVVDVVDAVPTSESPQPTKLTKSTKPIKQGGQSDGSDNNK